MTEISDKARELVESVAVASYVEGVTRLFGDSTGSSDRERAKDELESYIAALEAENAALKAQLTQLIETGNEMAVAVRKRNHPHAETVSDEWVVLLAHMPKEKNE